jgi:NADPH:quinone reductase-like Zn-dependent oxidoreductase
MRVAYVEEFGGIDGLRTGDLPTPEPAAGQVLVKVYGAGVGAWDVGMLGGGFPGLSLPFVPGQEIAGVVEAVGEGVGADDAVKPGSRVYGTRCPAGGGFAEWAVADAARLAPMPEKADFTDAAGLVIGAGTAHEGLVDKGRLQRGQTVLVTAASGGVGNAAVQIAAALGARVFGVASPANHNFVRSLGASEVFDYHDADWARQVRAAAPDGVDLLMDCAGGQTRDQALTAVRDGGRASFIVIQGPQPQLERGVTAESFAARVDRARLEALNRLVDAGSLQAHTAQAVPFEQAHEALAQVAGRHTRGKIVVRLAQ